MPVDKRNPAKKPRRAADRTEHFNPPWTVLDRPIPIPPQSVVRLAHSDKKTPGWRTDIDRTFRIGYYSRMDGLDCVWLVNDEGKYEQTTDHDFLYRYFDVIYFTNDTNWYGRRRRLIGPIRPADSAKPRNPKPAKRKSKK